MILEEHGKLTRIIYNLTIDEMSNDGVDLPDMIHQIVHSQGYLGRDLVWIHHSRRKLDSVQQNKSFHSH